ncbi:receptor-transporting protein 3-like isoform X2 [Notolabrus celidotus]|uniref:receptor-transporting protein 3-like isoform X2 n=1 Tax=Notolabrus celidotus TaxID=1203425 RepID=UPI00148F6893|nr:receptor-transporting protein 3-like isoform X2 [Notolabrus celidotus]
MSEQEWTSIFRRKALRSLRRRDSWSLKFDDSLVPKRPKRGWRQYTSNTSARCSRCGRTWPSNQVTVVFYMRLSYGRGKVKVRRFHQNCKKCNEAPWEKPSISNENIHILLENLVKKIKKIYCERNRVTIDQSPRRLEVRSPHEPDHCEACFHHICTQETSVNPQLNEGQAAPQI